MGAPVAWVLNLDADFELANRGPWEPPSALTELIEQISQTTSHEAGLATNVARHIDGILQVTAQTTSGTRQTATSVRQLTALTEELRNSVSRFKIA